MRRLAWIVVAGCGAPHAAPVTSSGTKREPPRHESQRAIVDYPAPIEPAAIACELSNMWSGEQPDALAFRDGGPPFANIAMTEARVQFDVAGVFVELSGKTTRAWGFVRRDQLTIRPHRAFLVDDWLIPGHKLSLPVIGVDQGKVMIEVPLPTWVKAKPLRTGRTCDDLTLDAGDIQPQELVPLQSSVAGTFADTTPIPVATKPGGPTVATLVFGKDQGMHVEVIERRDDQTRVLVGPPDDYPPNDVYVLGWVPTRLVEAAGGSGYGESWGRGGGVGLRRGPPRTKRQVTCTHEVPLVAEVAGEQHLVGAALAGATIGVLDGPGELVELDLRDGELVPAPGARILTKRGALADCTISGS